MNIKIIFIVALMLIMTGCSDTKNTDILNKESTIKEDDNKDIKKDEKTVENTNNELLLSMRMPKTLNPLKNEDVTVDNVLKLVFEPLFTIDSKTLKPVPNLAESYTLAKDGKSISIKIRDNLKWHDGNNIDGSDVVFSLDTIKNTPSSLYNNVLYNVAGYSAKGNVVTIKYAQPHSFFAYNLCFPIIPKHYYKGLKDTDKENMHPIGSASFRMKEYRLATHLILQKTTSFKGTPTIDNIKIIITPDRQTDIDAFNTGITNSIYINLSNFGNINDTDEKKFTNVNSNDFEYLGFNFDKPMFKDANFRKAIAYAIPSDEIIKTIYLDNAIHSITPINPNSYLGLENKDKSYALGDEIPNYSPDMQKVAEFFGKTNIDKKTAKISLLVNTENKQRLEVAELLQKRLASIGINIIIVKKPFDEYKKDLESGNFDMFLAGIDFGIIPNYKSFLSSSGTGAGGINYQNFRDAHMDKLIDDMYSAVSEEEFIRLSTDIQKYFLEQLPVVGIAFKSEMLITDYTIDGEKSPNIYNRFNGIEKWKITDKETEDKNIEDKEDKETEDKN